MDQLQSDLIGVTKERDSLKRKIEEASSSIELIDQPLQKLTRLLAGRFPENRSSKYDDPMEEKPKVNRKKQKQVRRDWLSIILLGLVLACCCAILFFILKNNSKNKPSDSTGGSGAEEIIGVHGNHHGDEAQGNSDNPKINPESEHTKWENDTINIKRSSGGIVKRNETYIVEVCKKDWTPAQVPKGVWIIVTDDDKQIKNDSASSFTVPSDLESGSNLNIKYKYNDEIVLNKSVKVK